MACCGVCVMCVVYMDGVSVGIVCGVCVCVCEVYVVCAVWCVCAQVCHRPTEGCSVQHRSERPASRERRGCSGLILLQYLRSSLSFREPVPW